jgi:peptidyl-prolyl cis-trans isomerase A (cyclophilin A)
MRKTVWSMIALAALMASNPLVAKSAKASKSSAKAAVKATAEPAFDEALLKPALLSEEAPAVFRAKFETTRGIFIIRVTRAWAPLGADRFYNLVKHGFYNGTSFFRVLPNFVAQWGISPRPEVTSAWTNAVLKDDMPTQSNQRGRVTFATAGPDTRTTQLFINLANNARLDAHGFAPFGEVEAPGLPVVDAFFSGYGEGAPNGMGPDQEEIEKRGRAYLDEYFSMLDRVKRASLIPLNVPADAKHRRQASPRPPRQPRRGTR